MQVSQPDLLRKPRRVTFRPIHDIFEVEADLGWGGIGVADFGAVGITAEQSQYIRFKPFHEDVRRRQALIMHRHAMGEGTDFYRQLGLKAGYHGLGLPGHFRKCHVPDVTPLGRVRLSRCMNQNLNKSHAPATGRRLFTVLFSLGLMSSALPTFAAEKETRPDRGPNPAEHMKHMAEELGLTDAQKEQVKSILQAQKPKLDALRENESLNRRQKMKQGRELRESVQKQIRALLTPEQQAKFDAMPRPEPGKFRREGGERPE